MQWGVSACPIFILRIQGGSQPGGGGRRCSGRQLVSGGQLVSESNSRSWKRTEAKAKEVLVGQMTGWHVAASLECLPKAPRSAVVWSQAESTEGQVALPVGSESP